MNKLNSLKKRGIPAIIAGTIYGALCIFSLTVGIYYMASKASLNQIELNQATVEKLTASLPCSINIFFGILTFVVGLVQGFSSYCLLGGKRKWMWGFALGFSIFSLISCSSKLFMSVNAFSIVKCCVYIMIIAFHFLKITRKNYGW